MYFILVLYYFLLNLPINELVYTHISLLHEKSYTFLNMINAYVFCIYCSIKNTTFGHKNNMKT